nr:MULTISPECIES: hypothetical protein [unclassified Bacteroides]
MGHYPQIHRSDSHCIGGSIRS